MTLEVPPGALTKATTISLTAIAAPSSTVDVVFTSGGVAIHPDGLQLALPATLTMTYDPSKLTKETDEQSQFVYFIDGKTVKVAGGRGYPVEDQDVHEGPELGIDTAANKVSVRLHHFSNYAAGAVVGELKFVTQTAGADAVRVISKKTGYATAAARSKTIIYIVLHHTDGGSDARLKSELLAGWTKAAAKKASAQYWVGRNGIIAATTEPDGKVGHGPPTNSYAPGIEMLNDDTQTYPIQQVLAVRRLVGFLAGKYGLKLRGQWLADWPAAARAVPPGVDFQQTPPAGSTPPKYDVVLGHREIDRHTWIVISRFLNWVALNAAPNPATHVVYRSDVGGKFYGSTGWSCGKDSLFSATVAANTEWRRAMPAPGTKDLANHDRNQVHTCFRPTLQTTNVVDITIKATAQRQDASMAWIDVGGDSTVTYALNNAPSAAGDRGTVGTAAAGWTPQARAGRRRRDPGGTEVFGFEELMAGVGYAFTGIIDTSGGDSYMHKEGGKGGNVTILAAHTFAAGHFGTAR